MTVPPPVGRLMRTEALSEAITHWKYNAQKRIMPDSRLSNRKPPLICINHEKGWKGEEAV
jgi:hypothetical protein